MLTVLATVDVLTGFATVLTVLATVDVLTGSATVLTVLATVDVLTGFATVLATDDVLTGFATVLATAEDAAVGTAAGAEDDATGLAPEDVAVGTAAGAEDDATGLAPEDAAVDTAAGAALITVDATVEVGAGAGEAAEVVAGGVVLAAAVDVRATGAVVLATAVVADATAAEVVATAAPETEDRRPPADAAEIGLTTAAMLSTRNNAQILRCRRRIAYRTAPSSETTVIVGDPLSLGPDGTVKTGPPLRIFPVFIYPGSRTPKRLKL